MLFNLDFANNTILSCFFLFFLIIDLNCTIAAAITIFNPTADLVIPIEIPSKETKAETEIHPVIPEAKIRKCSIQFRVVQIFCTLYSSIYFALFVQENNFYIFYLNS